jgi:hypothetical protein
MEFAFAFASSAGIVMPYYFYLDLCFTMLARFLMLIALNVTNRRLVIVGVRCFGLVSSYQRITWSSSFGLPCM